MSAFVGAALSSVHESMQQSQDMVPSGDERLCLQIKGFGPRGMQWELLLPTIEAHTCYLAGHSAGWKWSHLHQGSQTRSPAKILEITSGTICTQSMHSSTELWTFLQKLSQASFIFVYQGWMPSLQVRNTLGFSAIPMSNGKEAKIALWTHTCLLASCKFNLRSIHNYKVSFWTTNLSFPVFKSS